VVNDALDCLAARPGTDPRGVHVGRLAIPATEQR